MKPQLKVQENTDWKHMLKISPTSAVLRVGRKSDKHHTAEIVSFAEHCLHQFVDINETWEGQIKVDLDGLKWYSVVLRSGKKTRKYQAV